MPFWTYMLHCHEGAFYTGHADDLDHRIAQHQTGAIAGWTSERLPVELVWSQEFVTRDEAKAAEKQIKGWSRAKKVALTRGDWAQVSALARGKNGRWRCAPASQPTSSGQTGKGDLAEVVVSKAAIDQMIEFAAASHPDECCGILLGKKIAHHGDKAHP
ncbi:GIY-YIG nuclease family protein [Sphingomonadaceae bacterium]|nr:GIY-YIG nuclease family protein [Sphingomonadaceae bacterium]